MTTTSAGSALLELQELDLALGRAAEKLKALPELKELARKRAAYQKAKAELAHITGVRKDDEIDLEDLERDISTTERAVTEAQGSAGDGSDYRAVQDLELKLSDLAKRLDKLAFERDEQQRVLNKTRAREQQLTEYVAKLERAVIEDAERARVAATDVQDAIKRDQARRERVASSLDPALRARYEQALKDHHGLAVERLVGSVPSVCRMALTEASLADLARGEEITTCPYCHRMLIVNGGDEA